ncbi:MAG: glycosyltransferase family 4 protein [Calothrix sp. SM1_7_51]|nr:glycosyltransferase family 4 protein [Calothrix sp. SM1_7_51]
MVFNQFLRKNFGNDYTENKYTILETQKKRFIINERSIKLSVVTQFFPPDYAATGQLIEELVKQLGLQGVDVEVFTGQPGYAFGTNEAPALEQNGRVHVRRSRVTQIFSQRIRAKAISGLLFFIRALFYLLINNRRHNVLLVTTAPPFLPILGYLANVFFGISFVCVLYDLYPDIAVELGVIPKNHWLAWFWQQVNKIVWRAASSIVVLSPAMKRRVIANCPEVANKVSVIHSWADPDLIIPIAKQENWFAWKHDLVKKFTVLYSGNMGRCHDMDTIMDTIKLLQNEPIQFAFVGSGAKYQELSGEVERLKLKNCVFLPYQDKQVLPYSLTACDLSLVSVDKGFESLVAPSKLYGVLAAGKPVAAICSQNSYLRQMIASANCGESFENGNSNGLAKFIRHLNQDRQLVKAMGLAGRGYLEKHFTPEVISKKYLEVLFKSFD